MIASLPLAWPEPIQSSRTRPKRPDCPGCGTQLLLAVQSRFNLAGRIDHFWACDDCGTEFETSIEVTRQAAIASGDVR